MITFSIQPVALPTIPNGDIEMPVAEYMLAVTNTALAMASSDHLVDITLFTAFEINGRWALESLALIANQQPARTAHNAYADACSFLNQASDVFQPVIADLLIDGDCSTEKLYRLASKHGFSTEL